MTNRTREIFDFAQIEPIAVRDIELMVRDCNEEEIEHIEQVAGNVIQAVRNAEARFDYQEDDE